MYLATVLREMPNCWLIRRLLTPEVWSLNIRFIFRMSICLFAMVLFHKKRPLAHYRQIRSKSGSLSSGEGGSLSPASYAHFGPAKVVYYVRRFQDCLKRIGKNLDKKEGNLDSQEKLFLQTMVKGMLMPEKTNMAEFLLVGSYVQENMMRLSSRIKDLSKILESAVQNELSRQKGKEGPSL